MGGIIKLSFPATKGYWEVPILHEDEHFIALDKPSNLPVSPDRTDLTSPSMIQIMHRDIERGAPWSKSRNLTYLMNAHRLDAETSGVIVFAKSKPVLIALANQFGARTPTNICLALARGNLLQDEFELNSKIAPNALRPGFMRVDDRTGKKTETAFKVRERFAGFTLLECRLKTNRPHQARVHLQYFGMPASGDESYGGRPLLLSSLKSDFYLKPNKKENPLISRAAIHAEQLILAHPTTGEELKITAPLPKDFEVAIKYLRRYAAYTPR